MSYTDLYAAEEPSRSDIDVLPGITLLEFGAPWCGHCLAAQNLIAPALDNTPNARHIKIEDGRGRPLGRTFKVKLWPTLVAMRDGEELGRVVRPGSMQDVARLLESAQEPRRP